MKTTLQRFTTQAAGVASIATLIAVGLLSSQAQDIWTGNGSDANWQSPGNWESGNPPSAGDGLVFGGVNGLNNTNNFLAGTLFGSLTFAAPSGAFVLNGKSIGLNGNITNQQVVTEESINLPVTLAATSVIDVVDNGILTLNGVLSGSYGLTKTGSGLLNLNGDNTFTGVLTIDGGSVAVGGDSNLGAVPGSATPGSIVLNGGALEATAGFTLNANRGIAVGSASDGFGEITVDSGNTLSYGGVIADNGGTGTFTKNGYGTLTLSGQNTYSGATSNRVGALTLDFSQTGAPVNNIISPGSDLTLGGENAGAGEENYAELNILGGTGENNSQAFNSTHITFAGSIVQAVNGSGGSVNLNLGALSHDAGGSLLFQLPQAGSITTTSANINGILGGWALIGDGTAYSSGGNSVDYAADFATVNANGDITNFTGYFDYTSGNLAGQVTIGDDLLFTPAGPAVLTVDNANAGTTTEVNAIKISTPDSGSTANNYAIYIGQGNTLRLGKYGGILKTDKSRDNIIVGDLDASVPSGNAESGSQDIGTLTAGGADNASGEIVMMANGADNEHGGTIFACKIADNGSGKVSFVKIGPGSIKLDGHNTFSGGLYLLQGRVQFEGSEIGSAATTGNPDGGGTGPIYILPGSYLFPGAFPSGTSISNDVYVAGNGTAEEPLGAIRGGVFSGPIHLIGEAYFGGGVTFNGPITGPFDVGFGIYNSSATGGANLNNPSNDWTGDTIFVADIHGTSEINTTTDGANEVIPNGFGYGNVVFQGSTKTGSTSVWNLNGYNETINGLSSVGTLPGTIENTVASTVSTLTLGDNDQSGTFGGIFEDGGGTLALTKIGAGVETLTGANTYSGDTTVSNGTLALSGGGTIDSSLNTRVRNGAVLDVTGLTNNFNYDNALSLSDNGTLLVGHGATVATLNMTNGRVRVTSVGGTPNINATNLDLGGATNLIDIASLGQVPSYPFQFTIIKYSGSLSGSFNFGLGNVPSTSTTGYVSNNVADGSIDVVLLTGPEPKTWTGIVSSDWDVDSTTNWLAFGTTPDVYHQLDSVTFDDSANSGTVNLTTGLNPGFVEVTNNSLNYIFTGAGGIGGFGGMTKDGAGTLLLDNTGNNSFSGGFLINNGVVQVGNNDAAGSLPVAGGVENDATLIFDRSDNVAVDGAIAGSGTIAQNNTNVLTLGGNNTFTGPLNVNMGTLKAGSGTALGTADGATTISSGATLDVNGQTLNAEPVVVSGTGVGGLGAIINSGLDITTALGNVTLAGDTTFGGTGRWDIRGGAAILSTSGNAYNLTKVGSNQISLVGVSMDSSLADINVMSGTFSIEEGTTGLGNSGNTLTLASGATLQFYATTTSFSKQFVLNGNGVATTLNCGNGVGNNVSGPITLNGSCIFNAAAGSAMTFNGSLAGNGSMTMTGAGTNIIAKGASATYAGGTTVSNGVLVVDGSLSGNVTVASAGSLAGLGSVGGSATVQAGNISPGDTSAGSQGTLTLGGLAMNSGSATFVLSSSPSSGNDGLNVSGSLTFSGISTLKITPLAFMNVGDVYTLFTYGGSALPSSVTNNLKITAPVGFAFSFVDPATTPGLIQIHVDKAIGNEIWGGQTSSTWDTTTVNWYRDSNPAAFNNGDYVNFDDSSTVTNVDLSGALQVGNITMNNSSETYHFGGNGYIAGSGGLLMSSGGGLVIANNGSNSCTGPITISSGTLQLGDGGTNGNLGSGIITNNGALVFDRSDSRLVLNNPITGDGNIVNNGTGEAMISGANSFVGDVNVLQGTLGVGSSAALGNAYNLVTVSSGASLDIANAANIATMQIDVGGAGTNNNGAIVNNSGSPTFVGQNIGQVLLTSDTTIGGSGRIDFRSSTAANTAGTADAALYTSGQPYTLTKTGTNLLQMAGVQVDPGLGDVIVKSGTLGIQWNMPYGLGNSSYNLVVSNGASFAFFDMSNSVSKVMILGNGASVLGQHGTNNVFAGPVTLQGSNTFTVSSGATLAFNNQFGGTGSLFCNGAGTLFLSAGPVSYMGNTYVSSGTLALTDDAELTNTPSIILSNATIDVSDNSDATLSLGDVINQSLLGGGTINGALTENAGSTIYPGNGIATTTLTITNEATLNGNIIMDLDRTNAQQSDKLAASSVTVDGTITVTNIGPDLVTGDKFQLFSVPVSGSPTVNLPTHNEAGTVTYTWTNNLAKDGSITLLSGSGGGVNTTSTNIVISVSGGNLTLSWPPDQLGWTLETNAVGLTATNAWFPYPGSAATTNEVITIDRNKSNVFFRLMYTP